MAALNIKTCQINGLQLESKDHAIKSKNLTLTKRANTCMKILQLVNN
jgi:hypothetical protein